MALTETPVEINDQTEGRPSGTNCEGCYLNPEAGLELYQECPVVESITSKVTALQLPIALRVISMPEGEFVREDVLSKVPLEEGVSSGALAQRFVRVMGIIQNAPWLTGYITDNGVPRGGHRRYRLSRDNLPGICGELKNGELSVVETPPEVKQETDVSLHGLRKGWADSANCLGVDPDLFFPERGASTREAKEVCRGCAVRGDCLEYALANAERFGIWGGLSERERRRIRRQYSQERKLEESDAATEA